MRPLVFLAMPALLSAQVHVTFSQTGAEVVRTLAGRLTPGVGVAACELCNVDEKVDRVVPSGRVYQMANYAGISTIPDTLAGPLLDRQKSRSRPQIALDLLGLGTGAAGVLGTSKTIKMPAGSAAALSLTPLAITLVQALVTKRLPNDTSLRANLLTGDVGVKSGQCTGRLLLYRYVGDWTPKGTVIP